MAEFKCDVCGGKVVASQRDGWFLCENCGTEYPLEWMKAKFQKTQSVQIEGSVKVEGVADVDNLYKRAIMFLENSKWNEARSYFDKILDIDAEHVLANIGRLCVDLELTSEAGLAKQSYSFSNNIYWQVVMKFANTEQKSVYESYLASMKKNEERRIESEKREEREKLEEIEREEHEHILHISRLKEIRDQHKKYRECIAKHGELGHFVGLKPNGTVVAIGDNTCGECDTQRWKNIVAVAAGGSHTVGLRLDGTVVAVGNNYRGQCDTQGWTDIVAISASSYHTVGLKADGTVLAVGCNDSGQCNTENMSDITEIFVGDSTTYGLKKDGSLLIAGNSWFAEELKDVAAIAGGSRSSRDDIVLQNNGTFISIYHPSPWDQPNNIIDISVDRNVYNDDQVFALCADGEVSHYWNCRLISQFPYKDVVALSGYSFLRSDGSVYSTKNTEDLITIGIGPSRDNLTNKTYSTEDSSQKNVCKHCGGKLKIFGRKCKICNMQN